MTTRRATLPELLLAAASEDPGRPLLCFEGKTQSRGAVASAVMRVAGWFTRARIKPGDRAVLMLPNEPELLVAWLGANLAGAVAVPLDPALRGEELAAQLAETQPRVVIARPAALSSILALRGLPPFQ